jgi:hypothetical protein
MKFIRDSYGVPARRGGRVVYTGKAMATTGTITSAKGARLRVRMDGEKHTGIYHPTWAMRYLPKQAQKGQA